MTTGTGVFYTTCPCFLFEVDLEEEAGELPDLDFCMCGHVRDEHDEHGECEAEVPL